jgi:DDE family transposase
VRVLYNFGREDAATREALERLASSVARHLEPGKARAIAAEGLEFAESRPLGGTWVLDALWERLGIGPAMRELLAGRRLDASAERVLFALTANRALAPSSKLAAARWASEEVLVTGLPATTDDACYRAMDWLPEISEALEQEIFGKISDLFDREVDLLFLDTTSAYFQTEQADSPFWACDTSRDHRGDLPQVVIGMAVTRDGIPVRVWCWPGDTADSALIRQVKDDMRHWSLSRIIWVADCGFTSVENRRYLRRGGNHYIIGEKFRSDSAEAAAALSRQGRYQEAAAGLRVKEVRIAEDERFVICHDPEAAGRDAALRARMITELKELIDGTDSLATDKRAELRGTISARPGLNRYLRTTPGGLLRIDASRAKAEENLDGKYLLRTSDPAMSAEDIALGYRQLLDVERGWRDLKQVIDLRPVYHRKEERIRAHVILCWLALLLARAAENACAATWAELRRELDRIQVGAFTGPAGTFRQRTEITPAQAAILGQLGIDPPPKIYQLIPATP